jgi:HAMP domain-containing protein
MIQLGERSPRSRKELQDQRQRADRTKAEFETSARAGIVEWAVDDVGERRLADMFAKLDDLASIRQAVDAGRVTRIEASATYADVIDSVYRMYGAMATLDDKTLAGDIRTLMALSKAREILAREDALLAGALAQGRLDAEEHEQFTRTAGAWHIVAEQAASELPDADRAAYDKLIKGTSFTRLHDLETLLARQGSVVETIPFSAEQWKAATEQALTDFNGLVLGAGDRVVERATPVAVGVVVRLALAGGLGLIAVVASIVLSITTARALFAQLQKLRDAAHELSDERLPRVVERIGNGERVDVAVEAPPLQFGTGEIGQVGQAFNTVQETAIRIAAEQAALRQSIRDILISMARRTQGLVQRQLNVLDVMERRETDPVELEDLFRLDHLAVRTRRNAENLIVLSGSSPARTWRRSVPMVDVVRGALAEVEDYTRVSLMPMGDVVLVGRAVGDVVHLLAELIENAVSFSPPYTNVQVSGQLVANGYVVEIEDRGLGRRQRAHRQPAGVPHHRRHGEAGPLRRQSPGRTSPDPGRAEGLPLRRDHRRRDAAPGARRNRPRPAARGRAPHEPADQADDRHRHACHGHARAGHASCPSGLTSDRPHSAAAAYGTARRRQRTGRGGRARRADAHRVHSVGAAVQGAAGQPRARPARGGRAHTAQPHRATTG